MKSNNFPKLDIVCFSDIWWDHIWQRHQNIMTRLPKNWKILFIEPTSLPILIKEPQRIFLRKLDGDNKNIIIASLPSLPLIDRLEKFRHINDKIILLWLNIIMKLNDMTNPVIFYYEPRYSKLIDKLDNKLVVYDCVDDKLAFPNVPEWMKIYLDILINKANIIFVTSSNLQKKILDKKKDNVYLIGNGVDAEHFKKAMSNIPIPEDIKNIKKPIIGYIGAIDEWFDFDIIKDISNSYPKFSIILLGPVFPKAKEKLDSMNNKNIFFIGKRSYDILPNYLKAFDLCIIPFKINELTKSVNPVKLYEYLASGKNVISTDMPEIKKYSDIVYIANNRQEFINHVDNIIHDIPDISRYIRIVEENTWDKKVSEIIELIVMTDRRKK